MILYSPSSRPRGRQPHGWSRVSIPVWACTLRDGHGQGAPTGTGTGIGAGRGRRGRFGCTTSSRGRSGCWNALVSLPARPPAPREVSPTLCSPALPLTACTLLQLYLTGHDQTLHATPPWPANLAGNPWLLIVSPAHTAPGPPGRPWAKRATHPPTRPHPCVHSTGPGCTARDTASAGQCSTMRMHSVLRVSLMR